MKTPEEIAKAIRKAEARGEKRGMIKALNFFSTKSRSFGGVSAAEALKNGTSHNTVRATFFRVFGLDAKEYKEGER